MESLVKRQRTGLSRLFHLLSPSQQSALRVSRKRGETSSSDDYSDYVEILETCPELKNAQDGLTLKQKLSYFKAVEEYQHNTDKFAKFAHYLFCEIPTKGYNVGDDLWYCLEAFCDYVDVPEACVKSVISVPLYSLTELEKRDCLRFLTKMHASEEVTFGFLTRKTQWHPVVVWRSFKDFITNPCGAMISLTVACGLGLLFLCYLAGAPALHNHHPHLQATSIQVQK